MQGHAAANIMPVIASNRIGREQGEKYAMTFYGSSFIASHTGEKVPKRIARREAVLTAAFDLDEVRRYRQPWGVFRDRRPDLTTTCCRSMVAAEDLPEIWYSSIWRRRAAAPAYDRITEWASFASGVASSSRSGVRW